METLPLGGIRGLEEEYPSRVPEDVEREAAKRRAQVASLDKSQAKQQAEVIERIPCACEAPSEVEASTPILPIEDGLLFEKSEHAMSELFEAQPLNEPERVHEDQGTDPIQPHSATASTESNVWKREPTEPPPWHRAGSSERRADVPGPARLYPEPHTPGLPRSPAVMHGPGDVAESLEHSKERIAARWFALRSMLARHGTDSSTERVPPEIKSRQAPIVALFSIAGGSGKTTLVATLGRALSFLGERVLLSGAMSNGLLPFHFGASQLVSGVVRTFTPPAGNADAPIYLLSYDAARESGEAESQAGIVDALLENSHRSNRVLLDLGVTSSRVVEHLGQFKPTILIPLLPDMNSVISIDAVEKLFSSMLDAEGHPLQPVYLLNQFDASQPLHLDIREVLRQQLGERLLPFVVRRAPAVGEALAEGMTIVDYDAGSAVAEDYLRVANWLRRVSAPAVVGFRNQRWREQ